MEWLAAAIPIVISIATAIGGVLYSRKQGLPALKVEISEATETLITTLKDQLALSNAELTKTKPALIAAEARVIALESEVEKLERRVVQLIIRINELETKVK